jgi:hypothetical protein
VPWILGVVEPVPTHLQVSGYRPGCEFDSWSEHCAARIAGGDL